MKIVYFGSPSSTASNIMFSELIKVLKHRNDVSLVAVVDASKHSLTHRLLRQDLRRTLFRHAIIKMFNPFQDIPFDYHRGFTITASKVLPKEHIMTPNQNINEPEFVEKLKALKPDIAFSVACPQRFRKMLLETFDYCVNYHDALLPRYRGISSTAFSVYYGDKTTGYTFHLMEEEFDRGNILVQGSIPVDKALNSRSSMVKLTIDKTLRASRHLNEVLDCLLRGGPGHPQEGNGSYFGFKEWHEMITIDNLDDVNSREVERKLIICGYIVVNFSGRYVYVTNAKVNKGKVVINRIYYLPVWLWKLCEFTGITKRLEIDR